MKKVYDETQASFWKEKFMTLETEKPTQKPVLTPLEKEQQQQSRRLRQVTLLWLTKVYPAAFSATDPKPLKRHIEKDIFAQVEGKKDVPSHRLIRRAVAYYTNSKAYHEGVLKHSHRVDLEGQAVEALETTHKDFSKKRLEEIQAILSKNRKKD